MHHIQQESSHSCGIAAMQMITSLPEKRLHSLLGYSPNDINPISLMPFGTSEIEVVAVLFNLGYSPTLMVTREHLLELTRGEVTQARIEASLCLPTKAELYASLPECRAILCTTQAHMVVWNKDHVLDPLDMIGGTRSFYEYDICAAIFVNQPLFKSTNSH